MATTNHTTQDVFGTDRIFTDGFFTHTDEHCPEAEGDVIECDYDTRGKMACFRCVDIITGLYTQGEAPVSSMPAGHGGPGTGSSHEVPTATDKQLAFLGKLLTEHTEMDENMLFNYFDVQGELSGLQNLTRKMASEMIDYLLKNPGKPVTVEATDTDDVEQWLLGLDRKVTPEDMTAELTQAATEWAANWTGNFSFMEDMRTAAQKRQLTTGQAKGVLNCWRADLNRRPAATKQTVPGPDLRDVPGGTYAVPGGDTRLKVSIRHGKGKWAGVIFVDDGAAYGSRTNYGRQNGAAYSGKIVEELTIIAADPEAAAAAYGKLHGTCGLCGRTLEDEASIERGLGPVCAAKFG